MIMLAFSSFPITVTAPDGRRCQQGQLVGCVALNDAERVVVRIRQNNYSNESAIIEEVRQEHPEKAIMKTHPGANYVVDMMVGELLPRYADPSSSY
ncbi:hypothetical protein ACFLT8_00335 [Chloroflexota bacterium]